MKARWIEPGPDADENQEARFETWFAGKGISFVSSEAEVDYKARVMLMKDAIQLKKHRQEFRSALRPASFRFNMPASACMTPCMIMWP